MKLGFNLFNILGDFLFKKLHQIRYFYNVQKKKSKAGLSKRGLTTSTHLPEYMVR